MLLDTDQLSELELLSTLHDIGKMGISDNVLSNSGKLNDEEWVEVKKHPGIGFRIAYFVTTKMGWKGIFSRSQGREHTAFITYVISVADSYDAMTNDRLYRLAMTKGEAMEEIKRNIGTQFDPDCAGIH